MTFETVFSAVNEKLSGADVQELNPHAAFEFQVTGEAAGVFYVEVKDGQVNIAPYNYNDRNALFVADADTYMEIFKGELNPMIAFAVGRLKVTGDLAKAQLMNKVLKN